MSPIRSPFCTTCATNVRLPRGGFFSARRAPREPVSVTFCTTCRTKRGGFADEVPLDDTSEVVVQLHVLRLVAREQGGHRLLDQPDALPQVVRHIILLGDPLRDLQVLPHGGLVHGEREVPATLGALPRQGDSPEV